MTKHVILDTSYEEVLVEQGIDDVGIGMLYR